MKKILLGIFLTVLLSVSVANAAIVTVSFDETLSLSEIHGFGFTLNKPPLVDDVMFEIKTTADGGAVPMQYWDIFKTPDNNSIDGYDLMNGTVEVAHLSPGIALTITADTSITMSDFYLANSDQADGKYPSAFTILEETTDGIKN